MSNTLDKLEQYFNNRQREAAININESERNINARRRSDRIALQQRSSSNTARVTNVASSSGHHRSQSVSVAPATEARALSRADSALARAEQRMHFGGSLDSLQRTDNASGAPVAAAAAERRSARIAANKALAATHRQP